MKAPPVIAIIGGGYCGAFTLLQLFRQTTKPVRVFLINKNYPAVKGIAYGTEDRCHLLNVAAGKMSPFPEDPEHFVRWVRSQKSLKEYVTEELMLAYLPRTVYGEYLQHVFDDALKNKPSFVECSLMQDEAKDLVPLIRKYKIILHFNKAITVDKIILATGNFPPAKIPIKDERFYSSKNYYGNPWTGNSIEDMKPDETVFIIGSGLTMMDTALSIVKNGFRGKIVSLSRSGLLPLFHTKRKPHLQLLDDLKPPHRLSHLYEIYFKHIQLAEKLGNPTEALMDAIRPKIQEIWMSLSLHEKIQFMEHVKPYWNVTRHRSARAVHESITELIEKNILQVMAGRLISISETGNNIEIIFRDKKTLKNKIITAHRVINCTGPETDITKIEDDLIRNLLKRGFIAPDELKLGVNALPDGTIIQRDNSLSSFLFTIGTNLKGILWESTAVPELRVQTQQLAIEVLRQLAGRKVVAKKKINS